MSGIGRVPGSPGPVDTTPVDTDTGTTTPVDTTTPATPVSRTPGTARPAVPTAPPKASDIVPASILTKYGLDPDKMTTESKYDGPAWSVGYYPYSGDVQYAAFAKHGRVFGGDAGKDAHAYFEFYSNPPSGLTRGSWIASGSIRESDFERSTGVDVTGDRPIDNEALKLLREAGAPSGAQFALRDASGKQIPIKPGDTLVPTKVEGGVAREVPVPENRWGMGADVVWRIRSADGSIRYDAGDKVEGRAALTGAADGVKFDFLDATGNMVPFQPGRGDRIVPAFRDGNKWHVLNRNPDGSYEHQVVDGGRVTQNERLTEQQANALRQGKDIIYRVQARSGELRGDGVASGTYDMSWWGKCHNVASIGTSNMARPKQPVTVVSNLEAGDTLALRLADGAVLKPSKAADGTISGYTLAPAGGGAGRSVSLDEATTLAANAKPVIVGADGSLKEARTTTLTTTDVDALVSHIGDGAVVSKGGEGARYYAHPDILVMKDGRQVQAHIKSVTTAGGKTESIGSRTGFDYHESDRSPLRAPGMVTRILGDGSGRQYAFSILETKKLNEHRADDVAKFTVIHPDGREEEIDAAQVEMFAFENRHDFRPDQLWNLHKTVTKDGSTVIEQDPGTHVWNYTINSVDTTPLKFESLSSAEKERAARPGMMTGTVGEEGKYYFETHVNSNTYRYWARFDPQGNLQDYGYLTDSVPDFVWTQHVKDPYTDRWTGESQAPGIMNGHIQRMYLASVGGLDRYMLPGGVISTRDLENGRAVKPADR